MAIAAGSTVALKLFGIAPAAAAAGPLFGFVESGTGPFDVRWANGEFGDNILAIALDEILAASGTTAAELVGRQVKITSPAGQDIYGLCVCVDVFKRNGSDSALMRNPAGFFVEALAAQVEAV